jgi:hypothetical protein
LRRFLAIFIYMRTNRPSPMGLTLPGKYMLDRSPLTAGNFTVHRLHGDRTISCGGENFPVQTYRLAQDDLKRLGINPEFYLFGLKISLMSKVDYLRFCAMNGQTAEAIGGFYPLGKSNGPVSEIDRVNDGTKHFLSRASRHMVLPDDFSSLALLHETLHDIYFGGALSVAQREIFCRSALAVAKTLVSQAAEPDERLIFLKAIGQACASPYDIKEFGQLPSLDQPTREQRIFAGEVFTFAGERYLHGKGPELAVLPAELVSFFDSIRLRA